MSMNLGDFNTYTIDIVIYAADTFALNLHVENTHSTFVFLEASVHDNK